MAKFYGRPPKLTPDQVARLKTWAEQRKSAKQMAAELGISTSRLFAYLRNETKRYS
jgi:DNA-binding CsgD family transcriptional regulator